MSVARLWPLAFLIIEPLIILLYMIKQKAKDRQVPSTYLWREAYRNLQSDTPWEKLKHNIIMYLQLLAVLALTIAMLSPFLTSALEKSDRVVVALDTSASMLMENEDGKSRIDVAKDDLINYAAGLKAGSLVTVITAGQESAVVYDGRADGLMLKSALAGVNAEITDGCAVSALDYVRSLIREKGGVGYIYTDTLFDTGSDDISIINVANDAENYSVDFMQGVYSEDGLLTEYVGVTNHSKEKDLNADLSLYIEDELYNVKDIHVGAGESNTFGFFLGENGIEKKLKAVLSVKDALKHDNEREDFVYEAGLGKICLVTDRNTFLENAILASGKYELTLAESPDLIPSDCEIYIFDRKVPGTLPNKPCIIFESGDEEKNLKLSELDYDFIMSGVKTYDIGAFDTPIILSSEGECAGYITEEAGNQRVYIGFDLHMGDFVLDAEFPIFLYNTLESLQRKTDGISLLNFPAAESAVMSGYAINEGGTSVNAYKAGNRAGYDISIYFMIAAVVLLLAITLIYFLRKESMIIPVLRALALIFIVLAALNIHLRLSAGGDTVIYLIDASESNAKNIKDAEKFVKDAIATKSGSDRQAVIVFGGDVKTEAFLSENSIFTGVTVRPDTFATNIESAVNAGLKMIPAGTEGKLVLLTDGRENEGSLIKTAAGIRARGIAVDVVRYNSEMGSENYISKVKVPGDTTIGSEFFVTVTVESNVDTEGILSLYEESMGEPSVLKAEKTVSIHTGTNEYVFSDVRTSGGLVFYKAVLESNKDTENVNNSYSAFTKAGAGENYLLVSEDTENLFYNALLSAGVDVVKTNTNGLPKKVLEYSGYAGVILDNIPARSINPDALDALNSYVKDFGGGLITTGGRSSYAIGNMKDTVLEEMLPVSSDLKNKEEIPTMAMVYVIDHSGSMGEDADGHDKLDVAKSAAAEALNNLRPTDKVGVIAFDDAYTKMYELTSAENIAPAKEAIGRIGHGGGTSIFPAVYAAIEMLSDDDSTIKHIILLTDGQDSYDRYDRIYKRLEEDNITLSTVAVGSDADKKLLKKLAEGGSGRYYESEKITDLPEIFAQEVIVAMEEYLVNREFTPVVASNSDLLLGVAEDGMYPMYGYVAAGLKNNATAVLVSDEDDPILAYTRYGLGKVVSLMTDTAYKWTGAYAGTPELLNLYRNMTDFVRTEINNEGSVKLDVSGNRAVITYSLPDVKEGEDVSFTVTESGGNSVKIKGTPVGAGQYMAETSIDPEKTYAVYAVRNAGGEAVGGVLTGIAGNYSSEYTFSDTTEFEKFTEGDYARVITEPSAVYDRSDASHSEEVSLRLFFLIIALLLFAADIALRRFGIEIRIFKVFKSMAEKARAKADAKKAEKQKALSETQVKAENTEVQTPAENVKPSKKRKEKEPVNTGIDTEFLFKKQNERKR